MLLINTERKHDIVSTAKWLRKYATGLHNTHTVNIVEKNTRSFNHTDHSFAI